MSILSKAKIHESPSNLFILIYGPDGVGKTSFAAGAPNPFFLCSERGLGLIKAPYIEPQNYSEALDVLTALGTEKHNYKTLVLDSLDWLENLVAEYVCTKNRWRNVEEPEYGKGYVALAEEWRSFIKKLTPLRERIHIIAIGHSATKPFNDPMLAASYDRHILKLSGSGAKTDSASVWRESVDCVLFANFANSLVKERGSSKIYGTGDGKRVIYTERRPAYDAKNRFNLPEQLPLDWKAFEEAVKASASQANTTVKQLLNVIEGKLPEAKAFFVAKGWLEEDQDISELSKQHIALVLSHKETFLKQLNKQTTPTQE
jgi:hypothetical protein